MKLLGSAAAPLLAARHGRTVVRGSLLSPLAAAGLGCRDHRRPDPRAMGPSRRRDLRVRTVTAG